MKLVGFFFNSQIYQKSKTMRMTTIILQQEKAPNYLQDLTFTST